MVVGDAMATDGVGQYPCTLPFTFECRESNCCESYHSRFIIALVVVGLLVIALGVAALWFFLQVRPTLRERRKPVEEEELTELNNKSFEETKYLRRMSEMRFPHGRPL
uniref:Uncharacterized protein n=1 Tax=Plectus sambesii TaxID=2011161 RepID=A0A914UMI3_9BILA